MVCKYYLSSTYGTHRQVAYAAMKLCGILNSPFINIYMLYEINITTWREQKRPQPKENISFVSSTLLNGRTSCWIFFPFFLLSDAMLIFHSQTPSTLSTGYTWHIAPHTILHHLRKNLKLWTCWCCFKCLKDLGLSENVSSHHMTFQHHLNLYEV